MVGDEEQAEQLRYTLIPFDLCVLSVSTSSSSNPHQSHIGWKREWVLAEPGDKLTGERIYLELILNEEMQ